MTKDDLAITTATLRNLAGVFAERQRQEGQGARPPFQFFHDTLLREATRLQVNGAPQLAQAILALRDEIEVMDNG